MDVDLVLNDSHLCVGESRLFLFTNEHVYEHYENEINLSIEGQEESHIQPFTLDRETAEKLGKALLEWVQSR